MRIIVTGGAGCVGSNVAVALKSSDPGASVVAFDNLRRRGSELSLLRLREHGVEFVHGDVRVREDVLALADFDAMVECSAEPSVHAGYDGSPVYVLDTNLAGTVNCLEAVRRVGAHLVFLSTSRVYPIEGLRALPLEMRGSRFDLPDHARGEGWSERGITEAFPLTGFRSLYGASKLASELLIDEYRHMFGVRAVINRCGVIAGPWQMGKVDQGFVVLWVAKHLWRGSLSYRGFGGQGHQVRDVLHIDDLCALITLQLERLQDWPGDTFVVGGGRKSSVSLRELTALVEERTGHRILLDRHPDTAAADVPFYITDNRKVADELGWQPTRNVTMVVDDVLAWLFAHEAQLSPLLA